MKARDDSQKSSIEHRASNIEHRTSKTEHRIGVLLIQLGTPDAPTPAAVRRYLREFLSDRRVIETPRLVWWCILNLSILPRRSYESAAKYLRIWDSKTGSPLLHYTRLQAEALGEALPERFTVGFGMRYGKPSIDRAVAKLRAQGIDRLIALPLYPQYSAASTGTACDRLFQVLQRLRNMPALRVVPPFYDHPSYIGAQAQLIRRQIERLEQRPEKFIFSFHGYPVEFVQKGDPYQSHVEQTARRLAQELNLVNGEWMITYQSRFGRQVWLEPYTEQTLCELARQGTRRVLVASPGFTADCLETIDEIGREINEAFRQAGGECLVRCPCLNDLTEWIGAMVELVLGEAQGWYPEERNGVGKDGVSIGR